jgi:hypothetical protein
VKYSTIVYGFLAILGVIFLALVLTGVYLNEYKILSVWVFLSTGFTTRFGLCFVLGGIVFLTAGVVGVGRQYFKNHRKLFTVLTALLIPPLIFATFVVGYSFAVNSSPMAPLRSEITQVTVVDTDPLTLSVNVKAITSRDSIIEQAYVFNDNNTLVAYHFNEGNVLPAGSEMTLNLNFNTSIPSGNYSLSLATWHVNHGSSPFTIA